MNLSLKCLAAPAALAGLIAAVVYHAEGGPAFQVLLNLEALALVLGGSLAVLWLAYPAEDVWTALTAALSSQPRPNAEDARYDSSVLRYAADASAAMGLFATVLGLVLMLTSIDDVRHVPRRMALALDALLFGLFFSECIFGPLARRAAYPALELAAASATSSKRFRGGLAGLMGLLMGFFVILYALSAALDPRVEMAGISSCVLKSPHGQNGADPGRVRPGGGTSPRAAHVRSGVGTRRRAAARPARRRPRET